MSVVAGRFSIFTLLDRDCDAYRHWILDKANLARFYTDRGIVGDSDSFDPGVCYIPIGWGDQSTSEFGEGERRPVDPFPGVGAICRSHFGDYPWIDEFLFGSSEIGLDRFFLAPNVVSFEVTLFLQGCDSAKGQKVFHTIPVYRSLRFPDLNGEAPWMFPCAAEVTVLSPEGVAMLDESEGTNRMRPTCNEIVQEYGIEVVESIEIRTEGL